MYHIFYRQDFHIISVDYNFVIYVLIFLESFALMLVCLHDITLGMYFEITSCEDNFLQKTRDSVYCERCF